MADTYILDADGKTPIPCDTLTWALSREDVDGIRKTQTRETVRDGVDVSTVFLGLDHQFGDGPPLLWETMIFGGSHDGYQERYSTYDEAVIGHARAVERARND